MSRRIRSNWWDIEDFPRTSRTCPTLPVVSSRTIIVDRNPAAGSSARSFFAWWSPIAMDRDADHPAAEYHFVFHQSLEIELGSAPLSKAGQPGHD